MKQEKIHSVREFKKRYFPTSIKEKRSTDPFEFGSDLADQALAKIKNTLQNGSKSIIFTVYTDEDGALRLEWIHPDSDFRFGINIEQDINESSWFFVSREILESGLLPKELLEILNPKDSP